MQNNNNLVICIYNFNIGGVEKLTVDFINYCKSHFNFDIYVVCIQKSGILLKNLRIPDSHIFEIGGGLFVKQLIKSIINFKKLKKYLPQNSYIISQGEIPNLIVPWVFPSSHYVLVEHSTQTFLNTRGLYNTDLFILCWAKIAYSRAKKIIAISEGVKKTIIKSVPWKKSAVKVIYNFFDFENIRKHAEESIDEPEFKDTDTIKLLTVGRLFNAKDHVTMLKAFQRIQKTIDNAKLFIIGDGEEKQTILNYINENDLESQVFLLGAKKNPYKYMKHASLFLLSSIYEGFALVLYESLIAGTKVITTDSTQDMHNFISSDYGYVVPIKDYTAMADRAIELLKAQDTYVKKLPDSFKQFEIKYAVSEYLRFLNVDLLESYDENPSP